MHLNASFDYIDIPEYKLYERILAAGSGELLTSLMDPEVGDPLGTGEDGAGGVPGHVVPLTVLEQVKPEGRRPLLGPERYPEMGKYSGPALLHVRHVHQQGGNSVA